MRIQIKDTTKINAIRNSETGLVSGKECKFGITDELVFEDLFGENTSFIGSIRKCYDTTESENEYDFSVDKIVRGKIQSLHTLDEEHPADLRYLKLALEQDFGLKEEEYTLVLR